MEELQAQEGAQLPNLPKRFQHALTRGEAAFNGGFTDAGIRLGNMLKVRGAYLKIHSSCFRVQPRQSRAALMPEPKPFPASNPNKICIPAVVCMQRQACVPPICFEQCCTVPCTYLLCEGVVTSSRHCSPATSEAPSGGSVGLDKRGVYITYSQDVGKWEPVQWLPEISTMLWLCQHYWLRPSHQRLRLSPQVLGPC